MHGELAREDEAGRDEMGLLHVSSFASGINNKLSTAKTGRDGRGREGEEEGE